MNASGKQLVACLAIVGLAGCSSGSAGEVPTQPALPTNAPPARAVTLFVSSAQVSGTLASAPAGARGWIRPHTRIRGENAGLAYNYFAWAGLDSSLVWTTNCLSLSGTHGPVVAFAVRANGNSAPAISIGGDATGLSGCQTGIAVDAAGDVYVADITNSNAAPGGHVAVFAPGRHGNVAPARTIAGPAAHLHSPGGVTVDALGDLYVADSCQGFACSGDVAIFAPGARGNVAPARTIAGSNTSIATPQGVALDTGGNIYVANNASNSITEYAPHATGNASPIRTIAGPKTLLDEPTGIALDARGYLYVGTGDGAQPPGTHLPVLIFGPAATGNEAPVSTITFRGDGLAVPSGIALR
jgi:hypothetical protein